MQTKLNSFGNTHFLIEFLFTNYFLNISTVKIIQYMPNYDAITMMYQAGYKLKTGFKQHDLILYVGE